MPEHNYRYSNNVDMYTSMYEQYYFKNTQTVKVKPIKKKKKKNNGLVVLKKLIVCIAVCCGLLFMLTYSFKSYVADIFPQKKVSNPLKVDYRKMLFPTHGYLYKDLFLGEYVIKDTEYKDAIMLDMSEGFENTALKNRLLTLAQNFPRIKPSIYVWEYGTKSYVNIGADEIYPAASIIKVPVLIQMFREIESGKFSLDDTMVLDDYYRASGSGKLQYSQGGIAHSMDYLARIMIENSDNSSTNMIMAKMGGMPEVNRAIRHWGLKSTRINNWLPDLDGTNVTTAREMAKMFYNIDSTTMLSNESKSHIADYLSHVKNNRLLQAGIPSNAILLHKTGDIGFMLGDAGIVKTSNGRKYIVVILAKRPYNNFQGKEFIVEASKIIYNNIAYK